MVLILYSAVALQVQVPELLSRVFASSAKAHPRLERVCIFCLNSLAIHLLLYRILEGKTGYWRTLAR